MVIKLLFCDWLNSCKLSVYSILVMAVASINLRQEFDLILSQIGTTEF